MLLLSPLIFTLFFFYCYLDHRYLHSFPTRRSSDLIIFDHDGTLIDTETADYKACQLLCEEVGVSLAQEFWAEKIPGPGDRKSTRLNSSHLVISYAVFCLKKKIHIQTNDISLAKSVQ